MDGVLIIDKPVGPTSHDVVARVRRALGEQRVGHTGTLDPAASGVLPLVVGRATRLARFLSASDKSYDATIRLGWATDTADAQGAPVGVVHDGRWPDRAAIDAALDGFRGAYLQQPPTYSAKKIGGRRSYRLARAASRVRAQNPASAGETPEPDDGLRPAPVTVTALDLVSADGDSIVVRLTCSAGFYVRSLARDLGAALGVGGHLAALRRVRSGEYSLSDAMGLDQVESDREAAASAVVPLGRLLPQLAWVVLTSEGVTHARHGRDLGPADLASRGGALSGIAHSDHEAEPWLRLLDTGGQLLGLARPRGESGLLHPAVVLM